LVLVNERQLDFQFAVPEREDSYFTIAFNIAIRAGRFGGGDAAFTGSGGRREKNRNERARRTTRTSRRKYELRRLKEEKRLRVES
jgi:hypothetical protein